MSDLKIVEKYWQDLTDYIHNQTLLAGKSLECTTKGHGRCTQVDCKCECHQTPNPNA